MTNDQITKHLTRAEMAESVTLPIAMWREALMLAREALAARELLTHEGRHSWSIPTAEGRDRQMAARDYYAAARAACGEEG